jgi:hypothetical protein
MNTSHGTPDKFLKKGFRNRNPYLHNGALERLKYRPCSVTHDKAQSENKNFNATYDCVKDGSEKPEAGGRCAGRTCNVQPDLRHEGHAHIIKFYLKLLFIVAGIG